MSQPRYYLIENFTRGIDRRKMDITAPAGTLRTARNVFINAGGEVEKRRGFVRHGEIEAAMAGRLVAGPVNGAEPDEMIILLGEGSAPAGVFQAGDARVSFRRINAGTDYTALSVVQSDVFALNPVVLLDTVDAGGTAARALFAGPDLLPVPGVAGPSSQALAVRDQKLLIGAGTVLKGSALNDETDWVGTGSGSTDARLLASRLGNIRAFAEYYDSLAVFCEGGIQLWSTDPDWALNQYLRTIRQTPLLGPKALAEFGAGDLLFLSSSGVRSLRARDSSNQAIVDDLGSPIDTLVREAARGNALLPDPARFAVAAVPLEESQFWLMLGGRVFVLSRHPNAGVQAWTTYDAPALPDTLPVIPNTIQTTGSTLAFLSRGDSRDFGNRFYVFGGETGYEYDGCEAEIVTPHLDFEAPGTDKVFHGVDVACSGVWKVEVSLDPDQPEWTHVATVNGGTYRRESIGLDGVGTHIALRLRSTTIGPAKIGQLAVHYSGGHSG